MITWPWSVHALAAAAPGAEALGLYWNADVGTKHAGDHCTATSTLLGHFLCLSAHADLALIATRSCARFASVAVLWL